MIWAGGSALRQSLGKLVLASASIAGLMGPVGAAAKAPSASLAALPEVRLEELPSQAQRTQQLIRQGGPFPYAKDGVVFGNRERQLPRRERGYYREYTVPTPGARHRGAQRIVCGGAKPVEPEVCYYTADHYASFRRIAQ